MKNLNQKPRFSFFSKLTFSVLAIAFLGLSLLANPQTANAAFPGLNGRVVFHSNRSGNYEIYTMQLDGTDVRKLTVSPSGADSQEPHWSPDGRQIMFRYSTSTADSMYLMNADGTNVRPIPCDVGRCIHGSFSPDGTKIIFISTRDNLATGVRNIYTMNLDGTGLVRLTSSTTTDAFPLISPDGTKVLYRNNATIQMMIMNIDGTNQQNLSAPYNNEIPHGWSPDSGRILFYCGGRNVQGTMTTNDLCSMNADGSGVTRLTNTPVSVVEVSGDYTSDGSQIYYKTNETGKELIMAMDINGSNKRTISSGEWLNYNSTNPRIQPLTIKPAAAAGSSGTSAGNPLRLLSGASSTYNVRFSVSDAYEGLDLSTLAIVTNPTNGTASVNTTTGEITYTANQGYVGIDSLSYRVCSQANPNLCSTLTLRYNVTSAASSPVPNAPKTGVLAETGSSVTFLLGAGASLILAGFGISRKFVVRQK